MANLVLPTVFQVIIDKLSSFDLEKLGSVLNFKDDVEKLKHILPIVEAILEDAEEKQMTRPTMRIRLSKLKVVALDVEAMLLLLLTDDSLFDRRYANEVKHMLHALKKAVDYGLGFRRIVLVLLVQSIDSGTVEGNKL
ncbi:hypothetical protein PanWU01x14_302890 [Parasponia andersonii]|uniref:Disease resistance N-terminal domain-containing protein n=1 Tax=Parasponia andersonii TaxID=3476 RepID=A0A2P5ATB6_PARAD|nr:hypothetical protein PanWU01x14_302890 [Parasponia andersonii]